MLNKDTKICLSGGGTGGSVTPLLGLIDYLIANENLTLENFFWLGSKDGIEREMVQKKGIRYYPICSGKLRRYFSFKNFIDPFFILIGFFQSQSILKQEKPDIMISAGSFVSVPAAWSGWFLKIPNVIHQMDVRAGLANKLMAAVARTVTVTFKQSLSDYGNKAIVVGNVIRPEIKMVMTLNRDELRTKYGLNGKLPVLLVVGGGTGASAVNNLIESNLAELATFCQIIHLTGLGKETAKTKDANYQAHAFLAVEQMAECFALADVVISRAGLGFVSELAYLAKPSIIIPMPDTHQEENAALLKESKSAIVLNQKKLTDEHFVDVIKRLFKDKDMQAALSKNIHDFIETDAEIKITQVIKDIV